MDSRLRAIQGNPEPSLPRAKRFNLRTRSPERGISSSRRRQGFGDHSGVVLRGLQCRGLVRAPTPQISVAANCIVTSSINLPWHIRDPVPGHVRTKAIAWAPVVRWRRVVGRLRVGGIAIQHGLAICPEVATLHR